VQDYLRKLRLLRRKVIRQRLKRGIAEGDVPRGADLTAMAAFYATVVDGLAIQARDAASSKVLQAVVEAAMAAWDGLTSKRRP
jgi:hypothetical protein